MLNLQIFFLNQLVHFNANFLKMSRFKLFFLQRCLCIFERLVISFNPTHTGVYKLFKARYLRNRPFYHANMQLLARDPPNWMLFLCHIEIPTELNHLDLELSKSLLNVQSDVLVEEGGWLLLGRSNLHLRHRRKSGLCVIRDGIGPFVFLALGCVWGRLKCEVVVINLLFARYDLEYIRRLSLAGL